MLSIVARTRRKSRFAEKIIRLSLYNRTITLTNMEKYRNMKVAELKAILKQNNLSSKGNKKQLLTTIETYICETPVESADIMDPNTSVAVKQEVTTAVLSNLPEPVVKKEDFVEKASNEQSVPTTIDEELTALELQRPSFEEPAGAPPTKRKSPAFTPPPLKAKKKKKSKCPPQQKNSIMLLNELQPGLKYDLIEQTGNGTSTRFTFQVVFRGEIYKGSGVNKKMAKHEAAKAALSRQIQFENPHLVANCFIPNLPPTIDFTSDAIESEFPTSFVQGPMSGAEISEHPMPPLVNVAEPPTQTPQQEVFKSVSPTHNSQGKNPVQLLNEMVGPGIQYNCVDRVGDQKSHYFTMEVCLNGRAYQGQGKNKKLAKAGVAMRILREVYEIDMASPDQQAVKSNMDGIEVDAGKLPDIVFQLVQQKFNSIVEGLCGEQDYSKHKVLAGVVMTRKMDPNIDEGTVVSVATGTKCINGEYISDQGSALFDCHAEIVAKRGLRKFLYEQLLSLPQTTDPIFEELPTGGYKVKPDVYFHLYINTSPCGDARIFSPHETKDGDNHPNRKSRGQLRTKIENGEGTIPVEEDKLVDENNRGNMQQTWDAVIGGERLLTMSCSDKIAKWNVVGIQGSLLSMYIEPVYLSSIILGSLYHVEHFNRAVFMRSKEAIEAISDEYQITSPYRVHRPLLAAVCNPMKRVAKKAPTFCVHWSMPDVSPQVINTSRGRQIGGDEPVSDLCKKQMFKRFLHLVEQKELSQRTRFPSYKEETYAELKSLSKEYQVVKNNLLKGFGKSSCGKWVGKPSEVDMFIST
uniref:double-stranded RNA-specific editase 1-like isoform X2 n=1 Tax=Ciona intestinalis TaxID=7719 RepID=UPI000180B2D4|nr:double-stranded RNA-specific editase 1-like isoform X2 [Ciona intestinalis]|eukprot:XP_002128212.1 double-stranded RNA-specific editase 1-like isoform X2 [Ciona intestinalis]